MSERTVLTAADKPRHVVHRRNDGSPFFFSDEDYLVYLDCLKEVAERHVGAIHAYVLMPDHVQLLVSLDSETRLARLISDLGDHYAEYLNYTYQISGEFWEAPSKITATDDAEDLLACYREIETAPVRAHLAPGPAEYRWSSHRHHACGSEDAVIRDHSAYLELGTTQLARQLAYGALFGEPPDGRAPGATGTAAGRDPVLDADRVEDGIKRSVRSLAWQTRKLRERVGGRSRPLEGEARARGNASGIAAARAAAARRLVSK
jgi:REP element-mobilizing transposase RayT